MTFRLVMRPENTAHQNPRIWVRDKMTEDSRKIAAKANKILKMASHSKPQVEYPMTFKDVVAALLTGSSSGSIKAESKTDKLAESEGKKKGE
jgi:hypothetical protein